MRRAILISALGILLFFISTTIAVAKGPPDKITISGSGLTRPIEITDQHTLQQLNILTDISVFAQKGALSFAPKTDHTYEVLLYLKDENNQLQVRYAIEYVPDQPGYIYIPGSGDPWFETNIGSISRGSTIEGHWFYASKQWNELVQPFLREQNSLSAASVFWSIVQPFSTWEGWLGLGLVIMLAAMLVRFFKLRRNKMIGGK